MGSAVGIAQLSRGGNQKLEGQCLLLCHIAWSRISVGTPRRDGGHWQADGEWSRWAVGARSKVHPPKKQQPEAAAEGPAAKASAGLCVAARRAPNGVFEGQPAPAHLHLRSPRGCAHGSPGWPARVPLLRRAQSRPCRAFGRDAGNVVSTRLAEECSVYKTMAF